MEPSEPPSQEGGRWEGTVGGRASRVLIRCCLSIGFSVVACFFFSFFLGLVALAIATLSVSSTASVPSTCRILSSSVDLRSSKVCELSLLNYKAKQISRPSERRFRCRDDYYWTSVFQVEYKEYFSSQTLHAVAEAPKEALPSNCRPDFSTAWLTRLKFKVNETYKCSYMLGSRKAEIYPDDFFNCKVNKPSAVEMVRVLILFKRIFTFESTDSGWGYAVVGFVAGILASACVAIVLKSSQSLFLAARNWCDAKKQNMGAFAQWLRCSCLLVAYLSAIGWLFLQYGKLIGLKQLFLGSKLGKII